jgi:hypothetical protein
MRLVDNSWRVFGIAYWDDKNPGTMQNFETGQSIPIPRNAPGRNVAGPGAAPQHGNPAVPQRMAQEPAATGQF